MITVECTAEKFTVQSRRRPSDKQKGRARFPSSPELSPLARPAHLATKRPKYTYEFRGGSDPEKMKISLLLPTSPLFQFGRLRLSLPFLRTPSRMAPTVW